MKTREMALVWSVACLVTYLACLNTCGGAEYTSKSLLLVRWQKPTILGRASQTTSYEEYRMYRRTQRLLLKSDFVLKAALAKPEVAKLPSVRREMKEADPVRWLGGIIAVEFPDDAQLMSVSCTRKDPKEAKILTKAVVDAYMTEVVNAEMDRYRRRLSDLEKFVSEEELELRRKLETLNQLEKMLAPDDAKAAKKPVPVDVQMLRLEVNSVRHFVHEARMDLERMRIELQAEPRVALWEPAEEPIAPD
jgi:hypothetical protein